MNRACLCGCDGKTKFYYHPAADLREGFFLCDTQGTRFRAGDYTLIKEARDADKRVLGSRRVRQIR